MDCKEIQPVHSEEDQSQVFIGRTDAEAETPILASYPQVFKDAFTLVIQTKFGHSYKCLKNADEEC